MVGIAFNETLRLNVVAFPADPCRAQLSFVDRNGIPQRPPYKTISLSPGQADFLDFNANTVLAQFGQRMEVRPVVTLLPGPVASVCQTTAEVFDNFTGFTLLALQPSPPPNVPSPPPYFGLAGIAPGQILRLKVVALPNGPCKAQLSFVDRNGVPQPPPVKIVNLNLGQADFLDVSATSLGLPFGQRVELRPVVTLTSDPNVSACLANAEAYDPLSGRTWALQPQPPPNDPGADPFFGMAGTAFGQTLRLNVEALPNGPCRAQLSFVDRNGQPQPPPYRTVSLSPGQADFLDFNASTVLTQFGQRMEVRPVITLLPGPVASVCQTTAEVFDNFTGFTLLALQPQPPPVVPQIPPNFGLAGIAPGQTLRLNVVAFPNGPCKAQLSFVDRNGAPQPPPNKIVNLNLGQADFLDVSAASLGLPFGQRVELRPVVTLTSDPNASACLANAEAYDPLSGRTWALQPQGPG
jgi:hypothetical protein